MKKLIIALFALLQITVVANAMSYDQARQQALFLTDKMAYELNLTEDQYEAAYEINLDYLMRIDHKSDLYGIYWNRRNKDLSYILFDWQYRMYRNALYFYRPLRWDGSYWRFRVYARYPQRTYFYFGTPSFYISYRGGHSWNNNKNRSWYRGKNYGLSYNNSRMGMRDYYNRGDYRDRSGNISFGNGSRRTISTYPSNGNGNSNGFGGQNNARSYNSATQSPNRSSGSFGNQPSSTRETVTMPQNNNNGSATSFGGRSGVGASNTTPSSPNRTFSPSSSNGSRSNSLPSRSGQRTTSSSTTSKSNIGRSYSSPSRSGSSSVGSKSSTMPRNNFNAPSRSSNNGNSGARFGGRR